MMVALWSPTPALAAPQYDTGGPNGPCGPNKNVRILVKYKGGAEVRYTNGNGRTLVGRLPFHNTSYSYVVYTGQDKLRSWRVDIVAGDGFVSRDGTYGYCR